MKPETKAEIQEVLRRVVCCEIPVNWRSNSAMPGAGQRRSFYRGNARHEFESLDKYVPGDDPRFINWKATAQTGGQTIFKNRYYDQRDLKVFIVVDVSKSMNFGTVRALKRFLAAELAASICHSAEETADRIGFMAYSNSHVEQRLTTRSAKRALFPILASILETQATPSGAGSGLVKALSTLPSNRSLVFVLSDFPNLTDEEKMALKRTAIAHDVVCLVIQDRRERELPPGWGYITYRDMETGKPQTVFLNKKNRAAFAENAKQQQEALLSFFKQAHVSDWLVVSTEEGDAAIPRILQLFMRHRR